MIYRDKHGKTSPVPKFGFRKYDESNGRPANRHARRKSWRTPGVESAHYAPWRELRRELGE